MVQSCVTAKMEVPLTEAGTGTGRASLGQRQLDIRKSMGRRRRQDTTLNGRSGGNAGSSTCRIDS